MRGPGVVASQPALGGHTMRPLVLQYWQILIRRRWLAIAIVGISLICGIVVTLLMAPEYTASTTISISREQKRITNVPGIENDEGQTREFYATQYALLTTRPLAQRVAESLNLANSEAFFAAHGVEVPTADAMPSSRLEEWRKSRAVGLLLAHVEIQPVEGASLVDVSYTSRSPSLSAQIANEWARAFIDSQIEQQYASTADARKFLQERLKVLRERLEQSERRAITFASQTGIVRLNQSIGADGRTQAGTTLVESNLNSLQSALNRAIEARIVAATQVQDTADASLDPNLNSLRQQRTQLAAQYAQLMVQHTAGYLPAIEVEQQIKTLEAAIARQSKRIVDNLRRDYEEALSLEQTLHDQVAQVKTELDTQERNTVQYNIYQREADTNRQLYDALLQRFKEIGVAGTVGASQVVIVEPARAPGGPRSPNLPFNLTVALAIGVILSAIAVIGLEQIDEGVRESSEVERLFDLPVVGSVPLLAKGDIIDVLADSRSDVYEAYINVCSSLAFADGRGFPKSITVASTNSGEGKSVTAWALCLVLSRTGKRVLLIDADMRSPSAHRFAEVSNEKGLSNYLGGEVDWRDAVVPTDFDGLSLLPSGPTPNNAAELLTRADLSRFVANCEHQYDHVIIDTPPMLGLADSALLASTTAATVLVVEAYGTSVGRIRASVNRLISARADLVGAILTKLPSRYDEYLYGYGKSNDEA